MGDRRAESRLLCADMVEVHWTPPSGKSKQAIALLEDISPSGACLQLEIELPVGTEVSWNSSRSEFRGFVRYCEFREIGYFVGVQFAAGSSWSRSSYEPQHLLDVEDLLR